jgi:hypothetical protein
MFRYIVTFNGDRLAGFNHLPDAERFQQHRCEGPSSFDRMLYAIVDTFAAVPPSVTEMNEAQHVGEDIRPTPRETLVYSSLSEHDQWTIAKPDTA